MEARTDPQQDLCGIDGAGIFAGRYFGEGWYGPSPFSFLRSSDVLRKRNIEVSALLKIVIGESSSGFTGTDPAA